MELLFNELSIAPLSASKFSANEKMEKFAKAVAEARKKGFRSIRSDFASNQINLSNNYTLFDWLINKEVSEILKNFLFGMIVQPFIKDDDEIIESQYVEANYYFEDKGSNIPKTKCYGLASAYLYETLSVSLSSLLVWDKTKLLIIIEKEDQIEFESVLNVSSIDSFDDIAISEFVENIGNINLVETEISPSDKKVHLADHHGKSELQTFCNQLKENPYIIEMRSTNWGGKNFIRKENKDGSIEIVLFKTQRQYALRVQTTGRNLRETKAIAEILENKYY